MGCPKTPEVVVVVVGARWHGGWVDVFRKRT